MVADGLYWALRARAEGGTDHADLVMGFTLAGEYGEARRAGEDLTYVADSAEGRFDEAIQMTQRNIQLYPERERYVAAAANVLYLAGRFADALPLFERLVELVREGQPLPPSVEMSTGGADMTMRLAYVRRKAGDEEGAQAAVRIVRQYLAAFRTAGIGYFVDWPEAMIAAFEEKPDGAIAALKSAMQRGQLYPQYFGDAIFEDLRHEPRFVALQQEVDAIFAMEHEKVLQLICFNNPVPDDWQPMPETCEGVVEQRW